MLLDSFPWQTEQHVQSCFKNILHFYSLQLLFIMYSMKKAELYIISKYTKFFAH